MDLRNPVTGRKILCRLCAQHNEQYFEIFSEQGHSLKIAPIVSTHFWLELKKSDEHGHICRTCWWRIKDFHSFYLQVQEAQQCFEPVDECKIKNESMDFECTEYSMEESLDSGTYISEIEPPKANDCVNLQDKSKDATVQPKVNVANSSESTINLTLRDIILQAEMTSDDAQPPVKKIRGVRKRDHPSVLAGDDLIRTWCQMRCTKCSASFESFTFKDVKKHYSQKHDADGFLVCCRKKFYRRVRALEHIARHMNPREFSCEECDKSFADKPSLMNHLDYHVPPEKRPYKCNECSDSFVRPYQLSLHQKSRHLPVKKGFFCKECPKAFKLKCILDAHTRNVHQNETVLMCDICAKTFKSKQCLKYHFSAKHKSGPVEETAKIQCTICSTWLKHPNSLRGHMARHLNADTKHKCKDCGKNYPNRGALQNHRSYAHNTKTFPCTICLKIFKRPVTLKEHVAGAHTGEVLYSCPFCPKTFNSNANFYAHKKRIHRECEESMA